MNEPCASVTEESPSSRGSTPYDSPITTTVLCFDYMQTVVLNTTCIVVQHQTSISISLKVCITIDGGGQRPYISEQARKTLHMEPTE